MSEQLELNFDDKGHRIQPASRLVEQTCSCPKEPDAGKVISFASAQAEVRRSRETELIRRVTSWNQTKSS